MNGGIVTECPECETRFNVSEGQLKLADGKVRCGACLRVFDARAQQPYSEQLQPSAETAVPQRATPQQEYSLHVRYAQPSQPDTAAGAAREDARPATTSTTTFDPDAPLEVHSPRTDTRQAPEHSRWRDEHPEIASDAIPGKTTNRSHSDPIPIASLLRSPPAEQPEAPQPTPVPSQPELPDETPTQNLPSSLPDDFAAPGEEVDEHTIDSAIADATEARNTHTAADSAPAHTNDAPEPEPELQTTTDVTDAPDSRPTAKNPAPHGIPVPAPATTIPVSEPAPGVEPPPASPPQPQGLAALQDLHAEPLELIHPAAPAAPGAVLGWSLGCLIACVLLASQLAWFNRIEWSRQPALAEFYNILCHQVECAIPPYQVIELIHNRQLVVRAHPRIEGALSIDLLLENTADFRQPFPAIELSFSDIRGRTVARRVLQPRDYLDDALNPLKMAHSQPFQVNLAILDPGRRAVSYEVQLAPARL